MFLNLITNVEGFVSER